MERFSNPAKLYHSSAEVVCVQPLEKLSSAENDAFLVCHTFLQNELPNDIW